MKFNNLFQFITIITIFVTILISLSTSVFALTDLQLKAADLNGDGKINNQDMALLVETDYPERPIDGIPQSNQSPTGAILYTEITPDLGGRDAIQGFAITNIGTNNERIWFCTDGRNKSQAGYMWIASYKKGDNGSNRQYYRTFRNSGHGQIFDVSYYNNQYYLYIGSRGTGVVQYYNNETYRIEASKGFMQIIEPTEKSYSTSDVMDVQNEGIDLGYEYRVGAVDMQSKKIALMNGSQVWLYDLNVNDFSASFNSVVNCTAAGVGAPLQSADIYENYLYTISGYEGQAYVACFDISTGKAQMLWGKDISSYIPEEPEGIKVYNYNGRPTIFIATIEGKIYYLNGGQTNTSSENTQGIIEKATSWMEAIANDNSHGYNVDEDERYGQKGNFSCSGLNIRGWEEAGVPIRASAPNKDYQASNMLPYYLAEGFEDVIDQVNLLTGKGLQRGDVLLHSEGSDAHVEQYCGSGKMVGARSDNDGKSGDSGGHEIEIVNYQYNSTCYHFEHVLRYVGGSGSNQDTSNAPAATKPISANQLKLYKSSTENVNPRALPCLTDNSTQKIQSFAITDIGTQNEVMWYAYQKYSASNKARTYITGWKNDARVYAACLEYGGEGQGIDIDRIGGQYSIYTGSMAVAGNTGRAKGIYQYYANISSRYNNYYDKYNVKSLGTRIGSTTEISVDMNSGYAVVNAGPGNAKVYTVNNNTIWNTTNTFSSSNLVKQFRLAHPSSVQGGDLCGKYYYYLFGKSSNVYILCYDVTTGKNIWTTSIDIGSKIKELVPGTSGMEPEGMKVYYYEGSYKIFIGYKVAGYKSAIFYFDC